jgi:competence protein ComEC
MIKPKPNSIINLKNGFSKNISSILDKTESALALGFLIGEKDSLPSDFSLALQAAGLTHIVVASGYNLTILVRLAKRLFQKISKYLVAFSGFTLIIGFLMITGLSPSMFRAAIVASLSLLAWYYGRNFHPLVLILITMGITVFIDPYYIWGNLSWQLSFAAFVGVLILAPLLMRYLFRDGKTNLVFQILIETFSAQVLTAPLILASFGQFSNVSIIANLLVLPLVPIAMLLTFIAGFFGPIISILFLPAKVSDHLALFIDFE